MILCGARVEGDRRVVGAVYVREPAEAVEDGAAAAGAAGVGVVAASAFLPAWQGQLGKSQRAPGRTRGEMRHHARG